jgi:hypothetical protein
MSIMERLRMECGCELTSEEIEVLRSVFETVLKEGRSPTIQELQSSLKRPTEEIIQILDELEKKDAFLRKKGTQQIISIYPLSLTPTAHKIVLEDGTQLFAMCAVDALGISLMFNRDVKIVSHCEKCRQEITIEIKDEEIASMSNPDLRICSPRSQTYPAAKTCCPLVNFFCSKKHADGWMAQNAKMKNSIRQTSVKQAFPKIKECWKQYGETLGIR